MPSTIASYYTKISPDDAPEDLGLWGREKGRSREGSPEGKIFGPAKPLLLGVGDRRSA